MGRKVQTPVGNPDAYRDELHPPPRAWINCTAEVISLTRRVIRVCWSPSRMPWAVSTAR
jgi:hypothetical protein